MSADEQADKIQTDSIAAEALVKELSTEIFKMMQTKYPNLPVNYGCVACIDVQVRLLKAVYSCTTRDALLDIAKTAQGMADGNT